MYSLHLRVFYHCFGRACSHPAKEVMAHSTTCAKYWNIGFPGTSVDMRRPQAYRSELAEHLSHMFLEVREEAKGGLCDILVAGQYPIHLKVTPTQSEYDNLCGQILRTLDDFKHIACIIVGISSLERYRAFVDLVLKSVDRSRVRLFPKARQAKHSGKPC